MFQTKKVWFQTTSSLLTLVTLQFLCMGELQRAQAAERAYGLRLAQAAKNLGIDPLQVSDPAAYDTKRGEETARRRKEALAELERLTRADEQKASKLLAQEQARRIKQATPDAEIREEVARARSLKLSPAALQERLAKRTPELAKAMRQRAATERQSGSRGSMLDLGRLKPLKPNPPAPRRKGTLGQRTPELDSFYASLEGESVSVELADGSSVALETALAGVPRAPVRLASVMTDLGLLMPLLGVLPEPAPEDLAETPETLRSPELKLLAQSLGNQPLALYNHVHTKVKTELYYGSKKGAAATLAEGAGNDFDQASLLIALLREAGVPARYEYTTVRLSAAQAQALTGAVDARTAAFVLSSSGIPAALTEDGKGVLTERAYVRAYVAYSDYRGTGRGGENLWVRLDPGLKRVQHSQGVDLRGLVSFDFNAYLGALTSDTPREIFERQLLDAAKLRNLCNTLDDALAKATVQEDLFRLLPAEHPAELVSEPLHFARPPQSFRHTVELSLGGEKATFELAELQGPRVALRYPGATPTDEAAIQTAGGITGVRPYAVRVAPSLRVNGQEAKRFSAVMPGVEQELTVKVTIPGDAPAVVKHSLIAGGVYAFMASAGATPVSQIQALRQQAQGLTGDERAEFEAHLALALYSHHKGADAARLFGLQRHRVLQDVIEGTAGKELKVQQVNGTPLSLAPGKYVLDVARDSVTPMPMDADFRYQAGLMRLAGHHGSALEHKVWEEVMSTVSVSAVRIIQASASQGVPVFRITPQDSSGRALLQGFSDLTMSRVDQALAAGWRITIPQHPTNYQQYINQEGYILENPVTGEGAYLIGELLNGGSNSGPGGSSGSSEGPACGCDEAVVNSTVNMATGNLREQWTDLTLPAVGLPITWRRTYASRGNGMTELGYGWMHSYGMYLRLELNGSLTYITEDWREVRFQKSGSTFTAPPGWYLTLTVLSDGYRLRTKEGLVYEFNSSRRLRSISEPGGSRVDILYANGLPSEVRDSDNEVALSFGYTDGKLTKVTDRANRTVRYAYEGDDLVGAVDVLNNMETYAYDDAHNLVRRTDKRGKVWVTLYDALDRWVGSINPLGHKASAFYDTVNRRAVYVDRLGNEWQREHNAAGNPVVLVDPLGNRTERQWDTAHNLTQEKDARSLVTERIYDTRGNMTEQRDPDGRVTKYTYDTAFNQVLTVEATGRPKVTNTYDTAGRLKTRTDGLGVASYGYDARGRLETFTKPGPAVTRMTYGSKGLPLTMTDPQQVTTTLTFNSAGYITETKDSDNKKHTFEVDAAGQVTAMVDALNARFESTYDAEGHRLTTKNPLLAVTTYTYDAVGRVTSVEDALNGVSRTEYDANGRVVALVDARNARTVMRYDAAGRHVETVLANGASTVLGYCAELTTQPCVQVDATGGLYRRDFDRMGRVLSEVDSLKRESRYEYDTAGRIKASSELGQAPTTYAYGSHGLLERVTKGDQSITYGYDGRGNRTSVTAGSQRTQYQYDLANRLQWEKNPLNVVTSYEYDGVGNRTAKVDGNSRRTTYAYDGNRRLKSVTFEDGSTYQYDYDEAGRRTLEKNGTHARTLEYDALGRVKEVIDASLGRTLRYTYDANGNRTSVTSAGLEHHYSYDALNLLRQAVDSAGQRTVISYDDLGRRTRITRSNGIATTYSYDAASQLLGIVHAKEGAVVAGSSYTYDAGGNRLSKTLADGTRESYIYDASDRLTGVDYGTQRSVRYTLDLLGNRTALREVTGGTNRQVNSAFNAFNQLERSFEGGVATEYGYDNNGNLLSETKAGQLVKQYGWDLDNRLRQVTLASGELHTFEYDATGLRTKQTTPAGSTQYLLDGATVLQEFSSTSPTPTSYLTHPQTTDEILSFQQAGSTYSPLTDALGSVVAIADQTGAVVRTNSYDAYGARTTSGSGPMLAFGYTGREHDSTGLNYHRDRYMDPKLGRWIQPDRLGMVDGANIYQYVRGNPTAYVDPSGKFGLLVGLAIVIIIIVAAFIFAGTVGRRMGENEDFNNLKRLRAVDIDVETCRTEIPSSDPNGMLDPDRLAALTAAAERAEIYVVDFGQSRESSAKHYIGRARGREILLSADLFRGSNTNNRKVAFIAEIQHVAGLYDEEAAQEELEQLLSIMELELPEGWRHGSDLSGG
ncbi:RHS repeat-associated core domain-containing protein [Hyalangium minutum]|uniref:Uncharacterized protein n=1 Tax=Hyalangium minutum TaxID=394096 RepID=A0A085WJS1_9BACT|nr:RHS repeat-associated core domain-containing protein [Hyalangium minutum]KFE67934.1 hypothetical protein DB31_7171 [Hyalangium minutum]